MQTLLLLFACGAGYLIAYHTYGKFLARKIFQLNKLNSVPSVDLNDGIDFVPTRKGIIFGHHFTSIAGTGPIVGPAIGIIWGWLPALLWVTVGCILMGAVHDFGALVISLRNQGKSISEVAGKYINARVRFIFFGVVFLSLLIVIAVFGVVIAAVFTTFPSSVVPVWLQIPISVMLGYMVYKKNTNVLLSTAVAVLCMYATIYLGSLFPIELKAFMGMPGSGCWVIILLVYAWIASTLPITTLLQPRDYINAWQLFIAMGLLVGGIVVSSLMGKLQLVAPAINHNVPAGTPAFWPSMFVIVACGAISGFHSLISSGTSTKQVASESDSLFIGYGSMLMEGFLTVLVIICVAAGIGIGLDVDGNILSGAAAWNHQYSTYIGANGLAGKLAPVVIGAANMMETIGVPVAVGTTLMGVFIASFASTTLDTSVRLQRYVVSELVADLKIPKLSNRWAATTFAVVTAALLSFGNDPGGKGGLSLWPLLGSANQLLSALSLLVITLYLKRKGGLKYLVALIPCVFMLAVTGWAMIVNEIRFVHDKNILLIVMGGGVFLLAIWMTIEAAIVFLKHSCSEEPLEEITSLEEPA